MMPDPSDTPIPGRGHSPPHHTAAAALAVNAIVFLALNHHQQQGTVARGGSGPQSCF